MLTLCAPSALPLEPVTHAEDDNAPNSSTEVDLCKSSLETGGGMGLRVERKKFSFFRCEAHFG